MTLSRLQAIDLANAELGCLANHVANLEAICADGALASCAPGVEQLRSALARISSDIAAMRAAKIQ